MAINIFFVAGYAIVSAFGLYKIKVAPGYFSFDFVLGFLSYLAGFLMWMLLLKKYPLSLIFPLCSGMLLLASQGIGFFLLDEQLSLQKIFAVILVFIGSFLLTHDFS